MIRPSRDQFIQLKTLVDEILSDDKHRSTNDIKYDSQKILHDIARAEAGRRRIRQEMFKGYDLFFDPAWDILLELYLADASEAKLSVTAIGLESGVAPTTVIRWISVLESNGLVKRVEDALDKRRCWVYLTNKSKAALETYFAYFAPKALPG